MLRAASSLTTLKPYNGPQVRKRPHLQHFLERCAELFEVVVFTASQKIYAEQLLNVIDPKRCAHAPRGSLISSRKCAVMGESVGGWVNVCARLCAGRDMG